MALTQIVMFILVANIVLTVSLAPSDIALPQIYTSISYQLQLHLPSELFSLNSTEFSGKVKILFSVIEKTDYIDVHSSPNLIKFSKITFDNNSIDLYRNCIHDHFNDIATINVDEQISVGPQHELTIEYTGNIDTEDPSARIGLYRSSYVERNGITKYLLATQFASTHARTVFPCFDEPLFKATFNVSITHPYGLNAISNTEVESKVFENSMITVVFKPTPRISTYLLAFIVSDFTCTPGTVEDRIRFRVCSRHEFVERRNFALEMTPKLLRRYNNFTNYNYSRAIGKLDIVALPDFTNEKDWYMVISRQTEMDTEVLIAIPYFHPDLTENWGLIMHKENQLLYDENELSSKKQAVTSAISHELAHQWFGNLITFNWWSEIFVSKGLAAFFETYITNEVIPEWEVEKQFVVNVLHKTLVHDAFDDIVSHQYYESAYPVDVECSLSEAAYNKGGAIIRMVQHFMGLDNFRKGIQNYINKHKYGNVVIKDLWKAFDDVILGSPSGLPANVTTVMQNWTIYNGFPILNVSFSQGLITVSQFRFLYHRINEDIKWYIPISYTVSNETNKFQKTTPDIWLTPKAKNISFSPNSASWTILNNQQTGYYRVYYDAELMEAIRLSLEDYDFGGITEINRAYLVDDCFNFARANLMQYQDVLKFIRFLEYDASYYSWKAAMEGFRLLLRRFGDYPDLGSYIKEDLLDLIQNMYLSVPISTIKEDDQIYTLKQQLALDWACRLGDEGCTRDVGKLFRQYKYSGIRPAASLRYIVYCNGLRYSEHRTDWYLVWNSYKNAEPFEQEAIRSALGCSRDKILLKIYLQQSIVEGSGFKFVDVMNVFIKTENNPEAIKAAFEFLLKNQKYIIKNYPSLDIVHYIFRAIAVRMDPSELENHLREDLRIMEEFRDCVYKAYRTANKTKIWTEERHHDLLTYYKNLEAKYYMKLWASVALTIIFLFIAFLLCSKIIVNCSLQCWTQFWAWLRRRSEEETTEEPVEEVEMGEI